MTVRRFDCRHQPGDFVFSPTNIAWVKHQVAKYPPGRQASAIVPLLWRAQEQNGGWLSEPAVRYVADMLGMAYVRAYEIATFYTMFQLAPVGKLAHIQVCGTTPCMLRGCEDLIAVCKRKIAPNSGQLSQDGNFSWEEVECLGGCVNAPVVQVWKDTYEDLGAEDLIAIIDEFAAGTQPRPGSYNGRQFATPLGGATTLQTLPDNNIGNDADDNVSWDVSQNESQDESQDESQKIEVFEKVPALETTESATKVETKSAPLSQTSDVPASDISASDVPDGVPPGTLPPGTLPPGTLPPGTLPPGTLPPGTLPPGTLIEHQTPDDRDDLKQIKGIGVKLESALNRIGVFYFDQIAGWDDANQRWIDHKIGGANRVMRDDWVGQAKLLSGGVSTEFARRVKQGKVPSSLSPNDDFNDTGKG